MLIIINKKIKYNVYLRINCIFAALNTVRGRAVVARRAHNQEVVGSSPAPATSKTKISCKYLLVRDFLV